jgi:hypothetical protein
MSRQDTIKKIQDLRNLAKNSASTLEEAATAARIAERLIQANSIAEAELEAKTGCTELPIEDALAMTDWKQRQTAWQNSLLCVLADAYDCEGLIKRGWDGSCGFYAIGRPTDLATMRYQYAYFTVELTRLANALAPAYLERGSGKHWHKSFYLGAVSAIKSSLVSAKAEVRAQASSTALVVLNQHAMEAANKLHELYPRLRTTKRIDNIDPSAYAMGRQAGAGLQQRPALDSGPKGYLGK